MKASVVQQKLDLISMILAETDAARIKALYSSFSAIIREKTISRLSREEELAFLEGQEALTKGDVYSWEETEEAIREGIKEGLVLRNAAHGAEA